MALGLTPAGARFIEDQEANPYIARPDWPGGESGITIGYGYDLGQASPSRIALDWADLPDATRHLLQRWAGVSGTAARALLPSTHGVVIPQAVARMVFDNTDIPRACALTEAVFPHCDQLPPMAFAMLVDLVFNRGAGLADPPRAPGQRLEMRQIAAAMAAQDFAAVPALLRSMARLWPTMTDLQRRRQLEADSFAAALTDASLVGAIAGSPS